MTRSTELLCPEIEKQSGPDTVLFVCTGNTCRSPMAAAMFNHLYGSDGRRASSAGLYAAGEPIAENAVVALLDNGVMPSADNSYMSHISRSTSEELLSEASLVVAMTSSHAMQLIMRYPTYTSRITVMPEDIPDPYGGGLSDYKRCLESIKASLIKAFGSPKEAPAE